MLLAQALQVPAGEAPGLCGVGASARNNVLQELGLWISLHLLYLPVQPARAGAWGTTQHATGRLVRVGPVRIAISALAPFRPPGWGSVGCRTFVELNLSGALDARHHQGDSEIVSGGLCQRYGTAQARFLGGGSRFYSNTS